MSTSLMHVAPVARTGYRAESDALQAYFRDLDEEALMTADEEVAAAERIARLRAAYWHNLLQYPPLWPAMLDAIEASRKSLDAAVLSVLEQARDIADDRSTNGRALDALGFLSETLAEIDRTCDIADTLTADIEALATRRGHASALNVRTPRRDSAPFARYVQSVRRSRLALVAARQAFARANLRLVVTLAQRYRGSGRMSLADLIQEGNVGLMTAIDRFDPSRGFRFSTYGSWWIRHAIGRALSDKARVVRLPVHIVELQHKLAKLRRQYQQHYDRVPEDEELAALAGVSVDKIRRLDRALTEQGGPTIDEEGTVPVLDRMPDQAPAVDTVLHTHHLEDRLEAGFDQLRPMEADILRMRFGLAGSAPMTLREIGEIYSLSRERIRQIQQRALGKLRRFLTDAGFAATSAVEV